jgi:hypothetical protein
MTTQTQQDTRLFEDIQGGRIVCRKHLGGYGTAAVNAAPNGEVKVQGVMVWITPLDVWKVMTDEDRKEFAAAMAGYGYPDSFAKCEDCGFNPDEVTP